MVVTSTELWSWSPPFGLGPLNALHETLLRADDMDLTGVFLWLLASAPLLPQAYLLLGPSTRPARAAIGAVGFAMTVAVWLRYRFTDPAFNSSNTFLASMAMFYMFRYAEWGLLEGPLIDPWMKPEHGGRNRLLSALGLTMDVRGVYLGSFGLDSTAGPPNGGKVLCAHCAKMCEEEGSEGCPARVKSTASTQGPPPAAHLPQPPASGRPTDRVGSLRRHFFNVVWRFAAMDVLYTHIRVLGADTIQKPGGMPGALDAFADRVGIRLLPTVLGLELPRSVVIVMAQVLIPTGVCLSASMVYHLVAMIAIATGFSPPAAWDVDMFDSPFLPTSVIDLWGRRWHAVLRHLFVSLATGTIHVLHLPHTMYTTVLLSFIWSGVFHTLTHLAMSPVPDSGKTMAFFFLSGVACVAEACFRRATGMRVGGWAGRIWATVFMLVSGRLVIDAWADSGFMAGYVLPTGGVGDILSGWLWTWLYQPFWRHV